MQREDYLAVQNSNDIQGWTNNALIYQKKNKIDIFLPAYLRTKLKNIVSLDSATGIGRINIVIILSIYYDRIDEIFPGILQKLQNNVVIRFKIDPPIKLEGGFCRQQNKDGQERSTYVTKKIDERSRLITFSIRRMLCVPLTSHVFWSPFEYIKFVSMIAFDSIAFDELEKKIKIYFNLMDLNKEFDRFSVVSYTDEGALGEYDLASSKIDAEFSNKSFHSEDLQTQLRNKVKKKLNIKPSSPNEQDADPTLGGKIEAFSYGHSIYPVYRRPLVPLFNLFFPVVILGLINLAIYFQESNNVGRKIMNISALLVSYLYFLPIVREKIPPSNSLTITEIVLFAMGSLALLTFYHAISVKDLKEYQFLWNQEIFFQITLFMTLIIIAILSIVSLVFAFCFLPTYNEKKKRKEEKFDKKNWSNPLCDEYFQKLKEANFDIIDISNYSSNSRIKSSKRHKS